MNNNQFAREELLIGKEGLGKLQKTKIALFGIGGVGTYTCEALVRAGIGHIVLIDGDKIDITNLNRQLIALHSTIGKDKIEIMKNRILDINPNITVETYKPQEIKSGEENILDKSFDYVIDAVDTISTKLKLIEKAKELNIPIISSMGTGNKLDATKIQVTDIFQTSACPLAKVMRKELKKRGIEKLKVVYSTEKVIKNKVGETGEYNQNEETKKTIGSISFVPSVAGLIMAGEVVKDILNL